MHISTVLFHLHIQVSNYLLTSISTWFLLENGNVDLLSHSTLGEIFQNDLLLLPTMTQIYYSETFLLKTLI